jgi:hypothetical protein
LALPFPLVLALPFPLVLALPAPLPAVLLAPAWVLLLPPLGPDPCGSGEDELQAANKAASPKVRET